MSYAMNHRIVIQKQEIVKNEYGERIEVWEDFRRAWAEVRPTTGRTFWSAQQINSEITHQVVMRYVSDIKPSMRVIFKSRTFEILQLMNLNEGNELLQIMCKELVK